MTEKSIQTATKGIRPGPVGEQVRAEHSLDPADWEAQRALGKRMIDDMLDHLRTVRDRPLWQPMARDIAERFKAPVPRVGQGATQTYDDFLEQILPYGLGNVHPRFWGWVIGTGTYSGALAEFLAAAMNTNAAGFETSVVHLEQQVMDWFRTLFGMPVGTSGLLVSSCSSANFIALATALAWKLGPSWHSDGVRGSARAPVIYASDQTHFSSKRAARLLGLGSNLYRVIPSDHRFRIDVDALRDAIARDRSLGNEPAIIAANAGTVGVGAFDPVPDLAEIAAGEGLWLHVDGAFGAMAALTQSYADRVPGLDRADSLAFDLHKWLHVPIEAAGVLIRDSAAHHAAFEIDGAYISDMADGPATGVNRYTNLGVQQSRSARAIKVWFTFMEHGADKLGECVEMNMQQAEWLGARVEEDDTLELLAPVTCNIVCFRHRGRGMRDAELNAFNEALLLRLQTSGIALPTGFRVNGRYGIRCSITNHRTRYDDLEMLLDSVKGIADMMLENHAQPDGEIVCPA